MGDKTESVIPDEKPDRASTRSRSRSFSMRFLRPKRREVKISYWQMSIAFYHWLTWIFIGVMMFSQFLCIIWNTMTTNVDYFFGHYPDYGIAPILGQNDYSYSDRMVVCMQDGAKYRAMLASQALASDKAVLIDDTGTYKIGYRLQKRGIHQALDPKAEQTLTDSCNLIASTYDNIVSACYRLGYTDLVTDIIRLSDDVDSPRTYAINDSLPMLLMPHWDNAPYGRHVIPTSDGNACMFRLHGSYEDKTLPNAFMRGLDRSIRLAHTVEWLKRPGGEWRHGWYEDLQGDKWVSEIQTNSPTSILDMPVRQFDTRTGVEADCQHSDVCRQMNYYAHWGTQFATNDRYYDADQIYIGNKDGKGLFLFKSHFKRIVSIKYDWGTLLNNASVALLLVRWFVAMVAMHRGYFSGDADWRSGGIGCIASARSFTFLPFAMLPKLKMILCAFWTVGCNFEGEQSGLSEAWFTMYPSIVSFVLIYYSVLNAGAKALRRRVSDVLFAPTIITLCLLHYFRLELAANGYFKGVDSRVSTLVFSDEVNHLKLVDFFRSEIAVRLNGRVLELVRGKIAILVLNALPLVLSRPLPVRTQHFEDAGKVSGIEKALAVRSDNVGGLSGAVVVNVCRKASKKSVVNATRSLIREIKNDSGAVTTIQPAVRRPVLDSYDLVRLGYVVFGGKYIMRFDDWDIIASMAAMRAFFQLWNYRVAVWVLDEKLNSFGGSGGNVNVRRVLRSHEPMMCRLDDPKLLKIKFWDVSAVDTE